MEEEIEDKRREVVAVSWTKWQWVEEKGGKKGSRKPSESGWKRMWCDSWDTWRRK